MRIHLPGGLLQRAEADLSDLTASQRTGRCYWEARDWLVVPLDPEPSKAEQTAIRRRLVTANAEDEARLVSLLEIDPATPFEAAWLSAELARYGED